MSETTRYTILSSDEMNSLSDILPDKSVDYMGFKAYSDYYTQSSKTSANTLSDTRIDIYIGPKPTLMTDFYIECDM